MITEFLQYLKAIRGYSDNTIRAYRNDLQTFSSFIRSNYPDARWSTITRDEVDAFLVSQAEAGLKPSTTNRQLAAISSLYTYFQREGLLINNPTRYESRRKIALTIPTTIPTKQLQKAYEKAQGLNKTLLGILATTGIRLQELLDLRWQDVDFDNNIITVIGKGNKQRQVYTEPWAIARLKATYDNYKPCGKIFWISQRQARYNIYHTLAPYCKAPQLTPHAIRHTYATELAKAGTSTAEISRILGHKNISTSQKYIDITQLFRPRRGIIINKNDET